MILHKLVEKESKELLGCRIDFSNLCICVDMQKETLKSFLSKFNIQSKDLSQGDIIVMQEDKDGNYVSETDYKSFYLSEDYSTDLLYNLYLCDCNKLCKLQVLYNILNIKEVIDFIEILAEYCTYLSCTPVLNVNKGEDIFIKGDFMVSRGNLQKLLSQVTTDSAEHSLHLIDIGCEFGYPYKYNSNTATESGFVEIKRSEEHEGAYLVQIFTRIGK